MALRTMSQVIDFPGRMADPETVPAVPQPMTRRRLWWLARVLFWLCFVVITLACWIGYRLVRWALRTAAGL